ELQRLGVLQPAAAGVGFAQLRDGRHRVIAPPQLCQGVRLPVESAIGARRAAARYLRELLHGLFPVASVQCPLAALVIAVIAILAAPFLRKERQSIVIAEHAAERSLLGQRGVYVPLGILANRV